MRVGRNRVVGFLQDEVMRSQVSLSGAAFTSPGRIADNRVEDLPVDDVVVK